MNLRLKTDLLLIYLVAAIEACMLTRFVLKLFAARPDHPVVSFVFLLTDPLVRLFARLDAGQPRFGAVLEFSTLAWSVLIPCAWVAGVATFQRLHVARADRRKPGS